MHNAILVALLIILGSILAVLIIGSKINKNSDVSALDTDISQKALELLEAKDFEQAASLFRSSFEYELRALKDLLDNVPETSDVVFNILSYAQHAHQNAYILFRPYVSASAKPSFDQAWKEYCYLHEGSPKKGSEPFLEYKVESLQHVDSVKLAIKNIEKLLRFAEP